MDYTKHYYALINKSKVRGLDKTKLNGYFEAHHIIPQCMGGDDTSNNFVMLTAKEHYIAHLLLHKMHPMNSKLLFAINMMGGQRKAKSYSINANLYQKISENNAYLYSKENSLSFKDFTGLVFGRLTVLGLAGWRQRGSDGCHESQWLCECSCGNLKEAAGKNLQQGNTRSCGCLYKEAAPLRRKGIPCSEEFKEAHRLTMKKVFDKPWKTTSVLTKFPESLGKWALADYYHSLWLQFERPSSSKFYRIFRDTHNDNIVKESTFSTMVKMFANEWVPDQDAEWISFKENYNNE